MASTKLNVFFKGIDQTGGALNKMQGSIVSFATKAAAAVGGIFAARMLANKSKEIIEQVHAISDEARQVGASAEFFQRLGAAFGQVGLDAEIANKSLDFMRRNLATKSDMAGNIFEQMGLSAQELKSMGTEKMFMRIGEEISKLPNEVDKVKATYEIFGRSGSKLVPLFREGPDAFRDGLEGVMNMMPVVSDSVVGNLSDLDDTFAAIRQTLFTDFAMGLGSVAKNGEEAFGRIDVAAFNAFLKLRLFVKNTVAGFVFLKDSAKAIFTDDTIANSFDRLEDSVRKNTAESAKMLDDFEAGVKAKDVLANQFDEANNGAARLKRNIKELKNSLTGLTLAGSYAAIQKQFEKLDPLAGVQGAQVRQLAPAGAGNMMNGPQVLQALNEIAMNSRKTAQQIGKFDFGEV